VNKEQRDRAMTEMTADDRKEFRRVIEEFRSGRKASSSGQATAREVLESQGESLSPAIKLALDAVVVRDEMGPKVGDQPPNFFLKKAGSEERVRLSSFRGKRPVGLIFGSYT